MTKSATAPGLEKMEGESGICGRERDFEAIKGSEGGCREDLGLRDRWWKDEMVEARVGRKWA